MTSSIPPSSLAERAPVVLVVDDQPRNLRIVSETLSASGYSVVTAGGGADALARIEERMPDIVLLDLMMPGIDGLEVCRRLKARPATGDLPVIFLTAADEKKLVTRALELGAVDYVIKPFNPAELLARVRTHLELKDTRDELRRIIAQKNELMSVVAHDLKNPLSTIRFSALLLREDPDAPAARRGEIVDGIVAACDDSLAFINARLEQNAREAGYTHLTLGPVLLGDVLVSVYQQNHPAADVKNLRFDLDLAPESARQTVRADHLALVQVIDNLVSNAIKFTPPGRGIRCSAVVTGEGFARIEVSDEGPGLTADDHAHLFEPYRRLSAHPTAGESSTGLGLNIARRLVEAMHGHIGCDGAPGGGARFWVALPLLPAAAKG